ncbi:MAG: ChbG/HpnK family deacetylase [Magnetococcales bacterium]|nr:ChbG/HpnK family deacetylase [Magnetococcales bacterium]
MITGKALIVNADDFGLSQSVNLGILEAHHQGIVTSTTLLANGPAFEQGVQLLGGAPGLGVGVHLNVLRGRPLCHPDTLPLLTRHGRFHLTWSRMHHTLVPGMLQEIEREYRAQIEKVAEHGMAITHLDGEKHHHQFPPLFRLVTRLLQDYRIPAVRCALEPLTARYGLTKMAKVSMLNLFIGRNLRALRGTAIRHAHTQAGIAMTGGMTPDGLERLLRHLPAGITELCCHPGRTDGGHHSQIYDFGEFYIDATRETELSLLTASSVQRVLSAQGIQRITYAGLNPSG